MKIGKFVKRNITAIFSYCEAHDPAEFVRLQDREYSKETFDINYPFCKPAAKIGAEDRVRFWRDEYHVNGVTVRVTSQWFNPPISQSLELFQKYLKERSITFEAAPHADIQSARHTPTPRGRYKGNAIGNAQNLLVRNILSRLGDEAFSAEEWQQVIAEFGNRCAYCDSEGELVMEHVVSINKQALGEHRLGNLVPACRACNARKSDQDYRVFLAGEPARLASIEAHMEKYGYTPIGDDELLREIIEAAHLELRQCADRYVTLINAVMQGDRRT